MQNLSQLLCMRVGLRISENNAKKKPSISAAAAAAVAVYEEPGLTAHRRKGRRGFSTSPRHDLPLFPARVSSALSLQQIVIIMLFEKEEEKKSLSITSSSFSLFFFPGTAYFYLLLHAMSVRSPRY